MSFIFISIWRLSGKKNFQGAQIPNSSSLLIELLLFGQPYSTSFCNILFFTHVKGLCISWSHCLKSSSLRKLLLLISQALAYFSVRGKRDFSLPPNSIISTYILPSDSLLFSRHSLTYKLPWDQEHTLSYPLLYSQYLKQGLAPNRGLNRYRLKK